jgi:thiol:disulfide interchange protein DsbD
MKLILSLSFLFFFSIQGFGQIINENPLAVEFSGSQTTFKAGENTTLDFDLDLADKHTAYLDKFKISSQSHKNLEFSTPILSPVLEFMDTFTKKKKKGIRGKASLKVRMEFPIDTPTGLQEFIFKIKYQACTKDYCLLPINVPVKMELDILSAGTVNQLKPGKGSNIANTMPSAFEMSDFEQQLANMGLLAILFSVFLAGLLTSFTPCIYPMIPITLAILGHNAHERSRSKNFLLSFTYVLGIAITYALLGLFAAKTGALFGGFLGHPVVVFFISAIFVAMGLSMFGLFEIKVPDFITRKLNLNSKTKNYKSAFIAGMAAGILAGPCVGPVLVSILTYVAKTQDTSLGFILLFVFALGFGQIFLVLGTFSHLAGKLPRSGAWMNAVKYFFGVVMFAMAAYYAYPVVKRYLPQSSNIQAEKNHKPNHGWQTYSEDIYNKAKSENKNIIIDFWADWCAACLELEEKTFSKPKVMALLKEKNVVTLKFDATLQDGDFEKLKDRYGIIGLPNIVFYDSSGTLRKDLTLTGFENEEKFIQRLKKLK